MTKRAFLSGVGIASLAGALIASPAYASGSGDDAASEGDASDVSFRLELEADSDESLTVTSNDIRGAMTPLNIFAGIDTAQFDASPENLINFRAPHTDGNFTGSISDPDPRLIVRDDVGVNFGDPDNIAPYAVHLFLQRNADGAVFFNCSGSVINPRTILTAAHCLNSNPSESYGLPGTGAAFTSLVATGQSSADRLFGGYFATGAGYNEGGVASSTDVIIHPTANLENTGLPFPWADVALIAVDSPILDVPSLPILLTPLTELTHVVQVGYGTNGTGLTGGTNAGSRFLRRVGENMLGMIGSPGDYIDAVFPDFAPSTVVLGFESQAFYWTDFDNPDRTPAEQADCTFTGSTISCGTLAGVLAIDYFDGDALPGEAGTAPGDSGSPLVADQLAGFPLAIGVLSGGFDFFGLGSAYSDVSFYNPLYPFFEFITENTPYKYVSANAGDGNWSDPTHWTQDLDPGFFIQDGDGNIVNGIPTGNEPGIFEAGPKLGTVLGTDISGNSTAVTPGFESIDTTLPESSVLLGPGSTGFVPQNTDGTPGVAFANPAQYFEVHLNNPGRTTVDIDVEIDKLVVNSEFAEVFVPGTQSLTLIQNVEQFAGFVENNGTIDTPFYFLFSGVMAGDGGSIDTNALFNVNGLIDAGSSSDFGSFSIGGDYVQTSGGALWADFTVDRRRRVTSDFYDVAGVAVLDGLLVIASNDRRVRFGTEFTVLSADSIDGDFAESISLLRSVVLEATHRVEGNEVIVEIGARSIRDIVGSRGGLESLGSALDTIRGDRFSSFTSLFDVIDNAGFDSFGDTLVSLAPTNAFSQSFTANAFSQRFTGQVAQRTLSLRDGSRAAGGFTAAGNASFALAGIAPGEPGKLGVFGSASGMYLNGGQPMGVLEPGSAGYANTFEQLSLTQAGEITMGADLRVSEGFAFGIAVSNIRSSQLETSVFQPEADRSTSVAIYGTYSDGGLFADGYVGTADQRLGTERASRGDFAPYYDSAVGQSDSEQVFGGVRLGYAFDLAKGLEVGPVVSLDYVSNSIRGFDEIGAGAFGLSVDDRTFNSLGAKVGGMASVDLAVGETGRVRAFGSVAYARELADNADVVTAHFFGAEDVPFSLRNELDPEWVSVNAGAEIELGSNLRAALSVTSEMGRGPLSNEQAQATVSWRF